MGWIKDALFSSVSSLIGGAQTYIIIGGACLIAGGIGGYFVNDALWESAINKQKAEASQMLADATAKVAKLEREQAESKAKIDAETLLQQRTISDAHDKNNDLNRRLSDALRMLEGRGAGSCDTNGKLSTSTCNCSELQTTVKKLSSAVERIAAKGTELARDADREATVAGAAKQWANQIGVNDR